MHGAAGRGSCLVALLIVSAACGANASRGRSGDAQPPSTTSSARPSDAGSASGDGASSAERASDPIEALRSELADLPLRAGMFVVLDDSSGAALSMEGARSATRAAWNPEMGTLWRDPRPTVLAQVVRDHGDLVEIEFPSEIAPEHCTPRYPEAPPTKARWFVQKRLLWPVLSEPFRRVWPDRTEMALAPGLIVMRGGEAPISVRPPGLFFVEVPASHVALGYVPDGPPDVAVPDTTGPEGFEAEVGGHAVTVRCPRGTAAGVLVGRHRACARLVAEIVAPRGGAEGGLSRAWRTFRAGTEITDPAGVRLTELRADWTVRWEREPKDGRFCVGREPPGFGPYAVELCLPVAAATRGTRPFPFEALRY